MQLETERLILRRPEPRDTDAYMHIHNSEFVLHYNAMNERSRDEILRQFTECGDDGNALLMECKQTGEIIGAIFIEEDSLRYGVASKELSYFLGEAFSRQGYMKEALYALIHYLFTQEKLECVAARCFAPNTASRKLLASLGFHQDGLIPRCVKGYRDVIFDDTLHSILREDFK